MEQRSALDHRHPASLFAPALLLLLSCSNTGETSVGDNRPAADIGLTLQHSDAERITGTYRAKDGRGLVFDSVRTKTTARLILRTLDGREIADQQYDQNATVPYSGHLLNHDLGRLHELRTDDLKLAAEDGNSSSHSELEQHTRAVTAELHTLPEAPLVVDLSVALGHEGITGNLYPGSLPIHMMAMRWADLLDISVSAANHPSTAGKSSCDKSSCGMECDPCNDDCFGMCGRACDCWDWVCGDCCAHDGCVAHDQESKPGITIPSRASSWPAGTAITASM